MKIFLILLAEDAPCIGLCYHNKLMALEQAEGEVNEDDLEFSRGWPLNAAEFESPCVGLCYYFRYCCLFAFSLLSHMQLGHVII